MTRAELRRYTWRGSSALLALVAGMALADAAGAHAVGLSQGDYRPVEDGLDAELVFARGELEGLSPASAQKLVDGLAVTDDEGRSCAGRLAQLDQDETNARLRLEYRCALPAASLRVELRFWDELSPGHRHFARRSGQVPELADAQLLQRENPRFELAGAPPPLRVPALLGWVQLGVQHILAGYDHLALLLGLVLVASTLRGLAVCVSVFTVAHSLTLALASLELYAPPSALVEAAIAASICYVGCENLTARARRPRTALVFGFGLIHGFGFAAALREIGVRSAEAPLALLGFNLGVELGQLVLLAVAFPLVLRARRSPWFQARCLPALSAAIAIAGASWLVGRVSEAAALGG